MRALKFLFTAVVALSLAACNSKNSAEKIEFVFTPASIIDHSKNYTDDKTINNNVDINYYEVSDKNKGETPFADSINKDFYYFVALMSSNFDYKETLTKSNIKDFVSKEMKKFIDGVHKKTIKHRTSDFIVKPKNHYQNSKVVSLIYSVYESSSDAAHGISWFQPFNYDKQTCDMILWYDLTEKIDELTKICEKYFVEQNGEISSYNFQEGKFRMPNTFYFDKENIVFFYGVYEIANFNAGTIFIVVPNSEVKHLIKYIE
jgi:hypothetical protein